MENKLIGKSVQIRKGSTRCSKDVGNFSREVGVVDDCYVNDYNVVTYLIVFNSYPKRRYAFDRKEFTLLKNSN